MSSETETIRKAMSILGSRTSPRKAKSSAENGRRAAKRRKKHLCIIHQTVGPKPCPLCKSKP